MKIVYIMRGIPGSGKSTIARLLAGSVGAIHSTDDFFCVGGEYVFDPRKLGEYRRLNYLAFCQSLSDGVPVVICDNVNARRSYFEHYVVSAKAKGYKVVFVVLPHPPVEEAARRTIHKVPACYIQRAIDMWEN